MASSFAFCAFAHRLTFGIQTFFTQILQNTTTKSLIFAQTNKDNMRRCFEASVFARSSSRTTKGLTCRTRGLADLTKLLVCSTDCPASLRWLKLVRLCWTRHHFFCWCLAKTCFLFVVHYLGSHIHAGTEVFVFAFDLGVDFDGVVGLVDGLVDGDDGGFEGGLA